MARRRLPATSSLKGYNFFDDASLIIGAAGSVSQVFCPHSFGPRVSAFERGI
jgi:hypothetical protein